MSKNPSYKKVSKSYTALMQKKKIILKSHPCFLYLPSNACRVCLFFPFRRYTAPEKWLTLCQGNDKWMSAPEYFFHVVWERAITHYSKIIAVANNWGHNSRTTEGNKRGGLWTFYTEFPVWAQVINTSKRSPMLHCALLMQFVQSFEMLDSRIFHSRRR